MAPREDDGEAHLAAYGSLRPGEQHHGLVADLAVLGTGWLAGHLSVLDGYPVLRLDRDGPRVAVTVLGGAALLERWDDLDRFEGPAYRREQVVVRLDAGGTVAAQVYVASDARPTPEH